MTSTHLQNGGAAPAPTPAGARPSLGLPLPALVGLVALTIPRLLAHDLRLVDPSSFTNTLLAIVPLLVWVVAAAVWSRRPLASLLAAGAGYGVALAVLHNITWAAFWGGSPPRLGGNLTGAWSPLTEEMLMRGASAMSSIGTGLAVGLITGLLAVAVQIGARRLGARLPRGSGY